MQTYADLCRSTQESQKKPYSDAKFTNDHSCSLWGRGDNVLQLQAPGSAVAAGRDRGPTLNPKNK